MDTKLARSASDLDPALQRKLTDLQDEAFELWRKFDEEVRAAEWHPFVPADFDAALQVLLDVQGKGRTFLEWGSGMGVIAIMADMLGFEAYGIELDADLVRTAKRLAEKYGSGARFVAGSFLPAGYDWRSRKGDGRLGTISEGPSGYLELQMPLETFDIVYGYPWPGEAAVMRDVMSQYGRADAHLIVFGQYGQ